MKLNQNSDQGHILSYLLNLYAKGCRKCAVKIFFHHCCNYKWLLTKVDSKQGLPVPLSLNTFCLNTRWKDSTVSSLLKSTLFQIVYFTGRLFQIQPIILLCNIPKKLLYYHTLHEESMYVYNICLFFSFL